MGYYTTYKASFVVKPSSNRLLELKKLKKQAELLSDDLKVFALKSINDELDEIVRMENAEHLISQEVGRKVFNFPNSQWDHDTDMINISKMYPDAVFRLEGKGEENSDMWVNYYKNGKVQECQARIVFDDFDESKLVESENYNP